MRRLAILILASIMGCTSASTRKAVEVEGRTDQVRTTVVYNQHKNLGVLLHARALAQVRASEKDPPTMVTVRIGDKEVQMSAGEAALREYKGNRDLLEYWAVQDTIARCYRIAIIGAYLENEKGMFDKLLKTGAATADPYVTTLDDLIGATATTPPQEGTGR